MTRVWPFGSFFINLINVKPRMLRISELIHYKSNVNFVSSICFSLIYLLFYLISKPKLIIESIIIKGRFFNNI